MHVLRGRASKTDASCAGRGQQTTEKLTTMRGHDTHQIADCRLTIADYGGQRRQSWQTQTPITVEGVAPT
jgi:hypothetical protein